MPLLRKAFADSTQSMLTTHVGIAPERPRALARRVGGPPLVVCEHELVDPMATRRATKQFRGIQEVVIPDSGHVAQMEHPQLVDR